MNIQQSTPVPIPSEPLEEEIRDYAYHLYEQSGYAPGHDLDNWLEAKACIRWNIPRQSVHFRLHRHEGNRTTVANRQP